MFPQGPTNTKGCTPLNYEYTACLVHLMIRGDPLPLPSVSFHGVVQGDASQMLFILLG
jgi:hypothetical protein